MMLHGYHVFVANEWLSVWYEHFKEMHDLHGCNVFVVDPKIFVRNEKRPSSSLYFMAAMLSRPTNS